MAELIYTLEIPPEKVFYPNNELTNPKLANVLNAVRRLNDSELSIIKEQTMRIAVLREYPYGYSPRSLGASRY